MARFYLFNMIDRDRFGTSVQIVVNGCSASPYSIYNTYASIHYVPFSTSGAIVGGNQPDGRNFIDTNQLLATDPSGGLHNRFDGVATTLGTGDQIAFLSGRDIALYDQAGVFLAAYTATPEDGARFAETREAEPPGTAAGTVYIFNIFSEPIEVSSNGGAIGSISGWSDGSGTVPLYTPSVLLGERVLNPSEGSGKIANGSNLIQINSDERPGSFSFRIDGNAFPLNQSLLLFIARDHWRLTTQFGVVVAEGAITSNEDRNVSEPAAT